RPPDALDVTRVHRAVGLGHVDPVAHAFGQVGERVDMALDRGPAGGVERRDPIALDLLLARDAELDLDVNSKGREMTEQVDRGGHPSVASGDGGRASRRSTVGARVLRGLSTAARRTLVGVTSAAASKRAGVTRSAVKTAVAGKKSAAKKTTATK